MIKPESIKQAAQRQKAAWLEEQKTLRLIEWLEQGSEANVKSSGVTTTTSGSPL